jgi:hypothetical protein
MKAIETNATVNDQGQLILDEPLQLAPNTRVRIIIIYEDGNENLDSAGLESLILEGLNSGPSTPMTQDAI